MEFIAGLLIGFVAGGVVTWLYARRAIAKVQGILDQMSKQ